MNNQSEYEANEYLQPFEYGKWSVKRAMWGMCLQGPGVYVNVGTVNAVINWLHLNDQREVARALNAHIKAVGY